MSEVIHRNKELRLPLRFYKLLEGYLAQHATSQVASLTLNFRDDGYSSECGGYHPVEIRFERETSGWKLCYMTDFVLVGQPAELEKELDVCFSSNQVFGSMIGHMPLCKVRPFVQMFVKNFIEYHDMGIYSLEFSVD